NTGLNGATFTLENSDGSAVTTGASGQVNGSASCITAGGTSTAAATCSILNIQVAGTYQLAETSAPAGYNTVPPIPVTVTLGTPPIQVVVVDTATVVPTAAAGGTSTPSTAAVSGATTVHTGEPFAGSAPYVLATMGLGTGLLGFGIVRRRRLASNS
ncbi:MAG TPA: prealbumin-like fold domain-containing protein, partial [Acidimicrobiales bacterium]|nr:prealbumin-like fold domain-containing protein [Acidimicrobiales bacterium]